MSAKRYSILICTLLFVTLPGCQKKKMPIFLNMAWNRDYASSACQLSEKSHRIACLHSPDQIANTLKLKFDSAFQQTPTCRDVTISHDLLKASNLKEYEAAWSLSFNVGLENGEIDYATSEWQLLNNQTPLKQFSEGSLKNMVEAATRVCIVVTGR